MNSPYAGRRVRDLRPVGLLVIASTLISGNAFAESKPKLHDTGRVCVVDMGSNTFKFIVAEIKSGEYLQYVDERKIAGVGDDLKASEKESGHKIISEGKFKEIQSLLMHFQDKCEQQTHSRKIYAIATAAFREAGNIEAISQVLQQQGIDIHILSEEDESIYAYEVATLGKSEFAVIDLGSRTSEFVTRSLSAYQWTALGTGYKVDWQEFYEKAETFSQASAQHLKKLNGLIGDKELEILRNRHELGVVEAGETASFILGIPQNQIEGKVITRTQVQNKLKALLAMDPNSFLDLKNDFKDADKVLPRLVLLDFVLGGAGYDQFRGTNRELNVAVVYRLSRAGRQDTCGP